MAINSNLLKEKKAARTGSRGFVMEMLAKLHHLVPARDGFTLIELLVVISIIGLLASVVLVSIQSARAKSRDAKRIGDMNQLAKALELYFNENNSYPTVAAGASFSSNPAIGQPGLVPKYLLQLPKAPTPSDGSVCAGSGPNKNDYYYYANVSGTQAATSVYIVTFCLGGQTGSLGPGPHTLTQAGFQ